MNNLNELTNQRVTISNAIAPGVHGLIGPVSSKMTRYIFAQAKKGSKFFEVGEADLNGRLISNMGDDNNADARKILNTIGQ